VYCLGLENREYGRKDPLNSPRYILYPEKLALTSATSGGLSVGIVRLRTKATEFSFYYCIIDVATLLSYISDNINSIAIRRTIID
jgi:hypothetical protein